MAEEQGQRQAESSTPRWMRSEDFKTCFSDDALVSFTDDGLRVVFTRFEVNRPQQESNVNVEEVAVHLSVRASLSLMRLLGKSLIAWKEQFGMGTLEALQELQNLDKEPVESPGPATKP